MVIITLYNSKILLSLHYFLTPQFQTFTNLLIGIFGVSNPTFFFFRFLRNYVCQLGSNQLIVWFTSAARPNLELENPTFLGRKNEVSATDDM